MDSADCKVTQVLSQISMVIIIGWRLGGGWSQYKMLFYQHMDSHYKDKMVS